MNNHLAITLLCTFATSGYNREGQMATFVEGVWQSELMAELQKVTIETDAQLNPEEFNHYQFYQVESGCFACIEGILTIRSQYPSLVIELEPSLILSRRFHNYMASRQEVFLSDKDELAALGVMITKPSWNQQFVEAYKHYVFSTAERQCLFKTLCHIGAQAHLPLGKIMNLNMADGQEMFTDQDVGLAVNATNGLTLEGEVRTLYVRDILNRAYDNQNDPYFFDELGFRKYGSI